MSRGEMYRRASPKYPPIVCVVFISDVGRVKLYDRNGHEHLSFYFERGVDHL